MSKQITKSQSQSLSIMSRAVLSEEVILKLTNEEVKAGLQSFLDSFVDSSLELAYRSHSNVKALAFRLHAVELSVEEAEEHEVRSADMLNALS
jgi:hypothetical protein